MQSPSFSGFKLFLQTCLLQWFSNLRFGGIKFLLVPSISLCRSPLYIPACSPLNHLSHFCWQKFIHFRDNSTFISILHSFLSPPSTSPCFFLGASLSPCICLHYNKDSFTFDLPLCLTASRPICKFLGGRNHFLFIVIHPEHRVPLSPCELTFSPSLISLLPTTWGLFFLLQHLAKMHFLIKKKFPWLDSLHCNYSFIFIMSSVCAFKWFRFYS